VIPSYKSLPDMCYHDTFGSFVTKGVHINRNEPQNGERWTPLGWSMADRLKQASPHIFYHVKFGSSTSLGVYVNRRKPPKLGSAGAPPPCGKVVVDP